MSRYTALVGNMKKKVTLQGLGTETIEVELNYPLVPDLAEILPVILKKDKNASMSKEELLVFSAIIKKLLKEAEPEATDDELEKITLLNLRSLMETMSDMVTKSMRYLGEEDKKKLMEEMNKNSA
jgi:hypothetical protein